MKKLAMGALFVMLLFGSANAHQGALSLFTDATLLGCSSPIYSFESDTISMFYLRDLGPDLGNAVEFKIESSSPDMLFIGTSWNSQINVTLGDILTGISLTAAQCLGANEPVVYIGAISMMYTGFTSDPFTVKVVEDPNAVPPGIYITECDPLNPVYAIIGGTFVYNGSCVPGVKETSWGAIKALYK